MKSDIKIEMRKYRDGTLLLMTYTELKGKDREIRIGSEGVWDYDQFKEYLASMYRLANKEIKYGVNWDDWKQDDLPIWMTDEE